MDDFQVLPLSAAALDAVCEIEKLSFAIPWSRESYAHELTDNPLSHFVGCFDGERLLSFAGFWKILDEAHITNVAVHPDFRGQGIGELTMRSLMLLATCKGCRWMTLEVRDSNLAAHALYCKLGFKDAGKRPHYYENDEAALIMWTNLVNADIKEKIF